MKQYRIDSITGRDGFKLKFKFMDGKEGVIDFDKAGFNHPVFLDIKASMETFNKHRVEEGILLWELEGKDYDYEIDPMTIYNLAVG